MRKSGILVHPTSFPSPYGIGDLGYGAYEFLDFLRSCGCSLWQILPLGYTGFGDSPYQCFSAFAGNPLLISPDLLIEDGLLKESDKTEYNGTDARADYDFAYTNKNALLKKAYQAFKRKKTLPADYKDFYEKNAYWLEDFALFMALKNYFITLRRKGALSDFKQFAQDNRKFLTEDQINDYYFGAVFGSWPKDIGYRQTSALERYKTLLRNDIGYYSFVQYIFYGQWAKLKAYAAEKSIQIIGDIPIFCAMDASDAWKEPALFYFDENLRPTHVAGVPPDYFSETGQLWGNPLYDWQYHKQTNYDWWKKRISATLNLVDILRIDHFRGFVSYWKIKYGAPNAIKGAWVKGPGAALFSELKKEFPHLPIIAEDLGIITPDVTELREKLKLPGMKVLQFGFDGNAQNTHLPHNVTDTNTALYTGTHDNDTTIGWYDSASEFSKDHFRRYLNVSGEDAAWQLIRAAYASTADTVIIPLWDVLSKNTDHRMNTPGQKSGNWRFRYAKGELNAQLAERLVYLAQLFGR